MSYIILFLSAFAAATLLPLQSEAVLLGLFTFGDQPVSLLIFVATVGNVLGSCINWWLGTKLEQFRYKKWFPASEQQMLKAQKIYQSYGYPTLLLSWVPIIGDPLTLVAGLLKENFYRFLLIVTIAKLGRYLVVYLIYLGIF